MARTPLDPLDRAVLAAAGDAPAEVGADLVTLLCGIDARERGVPGWRELARAVERLVVAGRLLQVGPERYRPRARRGAAGTGAAARVSRGDGAGKAPTPPAGEFAPLTWSAYRRALKEYRRQSSAFVAALRAGTLPDDPTPHPLLRVELPTPEGRFPTAEDEDAAATLAERLATALGERADVTGLELGPGVVVLLVHGRSRDDAPWALRRARAVLRRRADARLSMPEGSGCWC